ncbi:MAG: type II secretion system protein N [Cellvibrionaceae bacterium]
MFLLKKRYWLTIALLVTLFLVLRAIPASWVIYGVQQAAPGFQVSGVSGSLWNGQASYTQWVDRGHTFPLGELQWGLQGLSLLALHPCINFSTKTPDQSIKGQACYGVLGGAATLKNVDASLPIANVSPYFNVDLEGNVDAYIKQAVWQKSQQLGDTDANLLWQRAALYNGNQWISLGDIQAQANDDGNGGLVSQWNSVDSAQARPPVNLDLNTVVTQLASNKPSLQVSGTIRPGLGADGLQPILQFIGEPLGDGSYRIEINE